MKQLLARLSAPFATFAATLLTAAPAAAVSNGCDEGSYNLIKVGPTVINLPARFCVGDTALPSVLLNGIVTVFNLLAIGIVLVLGFRLVVIAFNALGALGGKDAGESTTGQNESVIVRATLLSIAQALLIAVVGFLVVVNAPNLLLGFGDTMVHGYTVDPACIGAASNTTECFSWLRYMGVFDGLAARAQSLLGLLVIAYGSYLLGKTWIGYLMKTNYNEAKDGAKGEMKLEILKSAIMRTVSVGLVTGIAFMAIVAGPDIFAQSILGIGQSVIDSGSGCPDGNC